MTLFPSSDQCSIVYVSSSMAIIGPMMYPEHNMNASSRGLRLVRNVWVAILIASMLPVLAGRADAQFLYGEGEVIDGDTLIIDGITVRLFGIDAPEGRQGCAAATGSEWPCGAAAADRLSELVALGPVACQGLDLDDYGRTLAICDTYDGATINRILVAEGLAWAFVRYSTAFVVDEDIARQGGLGVWQAPTMPAWEYREALRTKVDAEAPINCVIKGNINGDGERIYHLPGTPTYEETVIRVENGERWFCTEEEALEAGWRAPFGS